MDEYVHAMRLCVECGKMSCPYDWKDNDSWNMLHWITIYCPHCGYAYDEHVFDFSRLKTDKRCSKCANPLFVMGKTTKRALAKFFDAIGEFFTSISNSLR